MDKRLRIQNVYKIVGHHLHSKWLPKTTGWAVRHVEEVGDTYCFELINTNVGARFGSAEIQLRREPAKYQPNRMQFMYELWAWNLENNKPEQIWMLKTEMNTIPEMGLRLGMMLEKILPSK
jgi:hypothetical protein